MYQAMSRQMMRKNKHQLFKCWHKLHTAFQRHEGSSAERWDRIVSTLGKRKLELISNNRDFFREGGLHDCDCLFDLVVNRLLIG